jgi:heptosyltransferase-2
MRILVVSNLYPPHHVGGYEIGCEEAVAGLTTRGHEVLVLTSSFGVAGPQSDGRVHRQLSLSSERFPSWQATAIKEATNQAAFHDLCVRFRPEVVFFWNLTHCSVSLPALAGRMGLPACYYVFDNWMATWELDRWRQLRLDAHGHSRDRPFFGQSSAYSELALPPRSLDFTHAMFASRYLRDICIQTGHPAAQSPVIPWGVDTARFHPDENPARLPQRLLFVGQLLPHKGADTAIRALGSLKSDPRSPEVSLTIVGESNHPAGSLGARYVCELRALAASCGVAEEVHFLGAIAREALPEIYRAHDVFLFTSTWAEPFGIVLLEALASGLAVVGTATGGSAEIIADGDNALVFPPGDSKTCAALVRRLRQDQPLFDGLRANARRAAQTRFPLDQALDRLEAVVAETARATRSGPATTPEPIRLPRVESVLWRVRLVGPILAVARLLRPASVSHLFLRLFNRVTDETFVALTALFFWRRPPPPRDGGRIGSVLVVQLAHVGDLVLSGPALRELRRALPDAWIVLAVQGFTSPLAEKCPFIDELVTFDWKGSSDRPRRTRLGWWLAAARLAARRLWKRRIDLAISLHWDDDQCQQASAILMLVSGAARRVGYRNPATGGPGAVPRVSRRWLTGGPLRLGAKHDVQRQLDILRELNLPVGDERLEVWTAPEDDEFARRLTGPLLDRHHPLLVMMAPGARSPLRRWPIERYAETASWLQKRYQAALVLVGGDEDRALAAQIESRLDPRRTVNLAGKTGLRRLAAVAKRCDLFVGADSGPMHVAAAAGAIVVGLFSSGEHRRFHPWGSEHASVRLDLLCCPCSERCTFDRPRCLEGITVAQVQGAVASRLAAIIPRQRLSP